MPTKRPVFVSGISILYFLSAGWVLLSSFLLYSGTIPLSGEQKAYFSSLTIFDYATSVLLVTLKLSGAVLLFLLRKRAISFFIAAFGLELVTTIYHIVAKNWIGAIGRPGMFGMVAGWTMSVAVIIYLRRLSAQKILT